MKTAYINGIILDGTIDMEPVQGSVIFTNGEIIEKISSPNERNTVSLEGYEIIDLNGQYIMPGLINMHVHLPGSGKPHKKQPNTAFLVKLITCCDYAKKEGYKMCQGFAETELNSGVTTIRTVGGIADFDTVVRDQILSGQFIGPRILASNMAISVPGGHMAGSMAYIANSAEETKDYVRLIAKDKPDLIKLMITGGVMDAKVKREPGVLKMPAEYVKAACEEAHALGFKVAAHTESPEGVKVALRNGVDTIEHGAMPDQEMIDLFKEHHASLITTISPALPYALFDLSVSHTTELAKYNGKVVFDGSIECTKECLENGIPVGMGTDTGCPFITHYDMWRELNYFHKYCGTSTKLALHIATLSNAQIAGISDITGSIEAGKCADFVVTKNNPLEHLEALRNISMVIARGHVIRDPKVKKMADVEAELDHFI